MLFVMKVIEMFDFLPLKAPNYVTHDFFIMYSELNVR